MFYSFNNKNTMKILLNVFQEVAYEYFQCFFFFFWWKNKITFLNAIVPSLSKYVYYIFIHI